MEFKNIHSFNPSSCISNKVLRINRITANVFRKYLSPFRITPSQLSILFVLSKKDGLTQKQMSDFSQLEKSSLNRNLNRLLERKYLTRQDFPVMRITHIGKTLVEQIIPEWEKAMVEISKILGDDGEEALNVVLTKLLNK